MTVIFSPKYIILGTLNLLFLITGLVVTVLCIYFGLDLVSFILFILGFSPESSNMFDDYSYEMFFFIGIFLIIFSGYLLLHLYQTNRGIIQPRLKKS